MTRTSVPSLALFSALLALAACDFGALDEALDDFRVILSIESQSTIVGGLVVDARTGDLVETPVTLTYSASVPEAVVDGFGDPIEGEVVEGGAFNFAISDDVAPESDREVEVTVEARAEGYETATRMIALADTGSYTLVIDLARPQNPDPPPPAGSQPSDPEVASGAVQANGASGVATALVLEATPRGGSLTTATVSAGAVLSDASGRPLSGSATVALDAYNSRGGAVLSAAPRPDGSVSVAGVRVSAETSSQVAASGDVRVSLPLRADALNPKTGRTFAPGELVEANAYDPESRTWRSSPDGTIVSTASGIAIDADIEHLGLFTRFGPLAAPVQTVTFRVVRNGSEGRVRVDARGSGYAIGATIDDGETSASLELPVAAPRTRLRATHNGRVYTPADWQTCVDCTVSLVPPSKPVTVTLRPECPSAGERVYIDNLPTFTLSVREQGTSEWFSAGTVESTSRRDDGSLESVVVIAEGLFVGLTYDVIARYLNETNRSTFTVPASLEIEEPFDAPASLCQ
ncbi:MAG: hypothetical protein AAGK21_08660 [Bacteroidota bacterium]